VEQALDGAKDVASLRAAFEQLVDDYRAMCEQDPAMRDIWASMQGDPTLRAIELAESRACGLLLAKALKRVGVTGKSAESAAFLVWQLGEATMRLVIDAPKAEGDRYLATYKLMAERALFEPA
jgi:hypothetical protein